MRLGRDGYVVDGPGIREFSLVDLDALGLAVPEAFAGRSLLPLVRGEQVATAPVFSQIRRFNQKWAVRTDRHKLVYTADTGSNAFGVPVEPDVYNRQAISSPRTAARPAESAASGTAWPESSQSARPASPAIGSSKTIRSSFGSP